MSNNFNVRCPDSTCLRCTREVNAASATNGSRGPKPGDITICIYCGYLMTFGQDLTMQELSPEQRAQCESDPWIAKVLKVRKEVVESELKKRLQ